MGFLSWLFGWDNDSKCDYVSYNNTSTYVPDYRCEKKKAPKIYCKRSYCDYFPTPYFKSSVGYMSADYKNWQHRYFWEKEHSEVCEKIKW